MTQDEMDAGVGTEEGAERSSGASAQPESKSENGVSVAFGRQLKLLRVRAGLDRVEFGKRVGYAPQSVASFEQGRRIPQPECVDKADRVLDAVGLLVALKEELARSQYPGQPGRQRPDHGQQGRGLQVHPLPGVEADRVKRAGGEAGSAAPRTPTLLTSACN
ncbi:helix-turn-helix domain-containing protein [Streptomyces atroolivaceus]|uniref:helix-turn-helix domain-containing protein n=1 Tax=Streptomyces atroolivaceus TaxID=66869 RepID=UPI003D682CD2